MGDELKIAFMQQGGVTVFALDGFFGQLEVYRLKNQVETQIEAGRKFLIADLTAVSFIDSAGIGSLVQIQKLCSQSGGGLFLVSARGSRVHQAITSATLERMIPIFMSERDALMAMTRQYGLRAAVDDAGGDGEAQGVEQHGEVILMLRTLIEASARIERRLDAIEQRLRHQQAVL